MSGAARRGKLFVLSGPSGVGKGTLRTRGLAKLRNLSYSVSCTTRSPRDGEREGVDYRFISKAEFEKRIARGLFLEYAAVHGNYYGTPREDVEREMDSGRDVLLEIDVQGARQVRKNLPGPSSVLIFVAPPSLSALEKRLRRRGTESEEKIALRLKNAKAEMEAAPEFDHVIVNDELGRACEELRTVFSDCRKN